MLRNPWTGGRTLARFVILNEVLSLNAQEWQNDDLNTATIKSSMKS